MTVRCSVLDLGSNSFHVLVADLDGATLTPVEREREMLHLGRTVARLGHVPRDEVARAAATVAHLTELARRSRSAQHVAVATAALRDASNGPEVIAALAAAAGTEVRTLSDVDEARLGYLGVRSSIAIPGDPIVVLDLGGGSLEVTAGGGSTVAWATSAPLGISRLSALVDHDPITRAEVEALHRHVDTHIRPLRDAVAELQPVATVAVGGTVRALARVVAAEDQIWLPASINQLEIPGAELGRVRDELVVGDLDARMQVPGMKRRRADHLHIAGIVLTQVLERLEIDRVVVSDWGLREGLLLDLHGVSSPPGPAELRAREVGRLRRTFVTDHPSHLDHVARLAGRLFDQLQDVHGCGPPDRELLEHAARLHDIGETLALRRHHLHGAYMVAHAEMRGFAPHDIAMLSTLVRYHVSRGIDKDHPAFASLSAQDRDRTRKLLPLLQLATQLDRTRDGAVRDVTATRQDGRVVLTATGRSGGTAPLDLLDEQRLASLFAATYKVGLALEGSEDAA